MVHIPHGPTKMTVSKGLASILAAIAVTAPIQANAAPLAAATDVTFTQSVLTPSQTKAQLVFFWAAWAGPARMEKQTLEMVEPDYVTKVAMWQLDIDSNPGTPSKYGVTGVPTMLIFKKGVVTAKQVGALNEAQLRSWLDKNAP